MATDSNYTPALSPASDDVDLDYAEDQDEDDRPGPSRRRAGAKGGKKGQNGATGGGKGEDGRQAWEGMYKRSWDVVQEDEGGGLQAAVDSLIARGRRKR
jgi:transcription initiation factor TFIIH subunit 2